MEIPNLEEFVKSEIGSIENSLFSVAKKGSYEKGYRDGAISAYERLLAYIEYVRTEGQ